LSNYHQEVRDLIYLDHPNINAIQDYIKANNTLYKVSHYISGKSLNTYVENRRLTEKELTTLLKPLLSGINVIHQAGYLHGEINPNTIMIENKTKRLVITNLGSPKHLFLGHKNSPRLLSTNYTAHEQYHGTEKQGVWTDIYAMGMILYELTTGRSATASMARLHTNDPIIPAQTIAKDNYSKHFLAAIDHAIQLAITERPHHLKTWEKELGIISEIRLEGNNKDKSHEAPASMEKSRQESDDSLPIKKELTIAGLSMTNTNNESPAYMDFDAISQPLSFSQKLMGNNKKYTAIILLITLIAIIAGGAFYYLPNDFKSATFIEKLTTY